MIQLTRYESKSWRLDTSYGMVSWLEYCHCEVKRLIDLGREAVIKESEKNYHIAIWADEPSQPKKEVKTSCYRPLTGYMPKKK